MIFLTPYFGLLLTCFVTLKNHLRDPGFFVRKGQSPDMGRAATVSLGYKSKWNLSLLCPDNIVASEG